MPTAFYLVLPLLASCTGTGVDTGFEIPDGTVSSAKIAAGAVHGFHLADGAVESRTIAEGAVGAEHLSDDVLSGIDLGEGSVEAFHLAEGAVTAPAVAAGAIGNDAIADGAIDSSGLADESVESRHIGSGAVGADALADGAVGADHIAAAAVTAVHLADDSVGAEQLASGAVSSDAIASGSITSTHLATNAVGSDEIAASAVGSSEIATSAVGSSEIASGAVGSSEIATGAVDSDEIASDAVTATHIAAGAVGSSEIATSAVDSAEIASGAVDSSEIADGAVDSDQLDDSINFGSSSSGDGYWYIYRSGYSNRWTYGGANETDGVGRLATYYESSGNTAVQASSASSSGLAYLGVNADDSSCCEAAMYINSSGEGVVFGDTKSFVEDHPTDDDLRIVYTSLEGPEAGLYVRGTATLEGGYAIVEFPDHFVWLAAPEDLTAFVTPTSSGSRGLAVVELDSAYMIVEELDGGTGNYPFYYRVEGVRVGYEGYEPIRHRSELEAAAVQEDPED